MCIKPLHGVGRTGATATSRISLDLTAEKDVNEGDEERAAGLAATVERRVSRQFQPLHFRRCAMGSEGPTQALRVPPCPTSLPKSLLSPRQTSHHRAEWKSPQIPKRDAELHFLGEIRTYVFLGPRN